jgi:hypothetical protein
VARPLRFVRRPHEARFETTPAQRTPAPSEDVSPRPRDTDPPAEPSAPLPIFWSPQRRAPIAPAPAAPPVADDPWPELPERSALPPEDVSRALRVFQRAVVLRDEQIGTRWSA